MNTISGGFACEKFQAAGASEEHETTPQRYRSAARSAGTSPPRKAITQHETAPLRQAYRDREGIE